MLSQTARNVVKSGVSEAVQLRHGLMISRLYYAVIKLVGVDWVNVMTHFPYSLRLQSSSDKHLSLAKFSSRPAGEVPTMEVAEKS